MSAQEPRSLEEFQIAAQEVWDGLPATFRDVVGNLSIHIRDFADRDTLDRMRIRNEYNLLGLYHGIGLPFKSTWDVPHGPDMIFLYRIPILAFAHTDRQPVRDVIAHVLIHEIGHHFGFSDDDMHAIEAATP
ncbi:MULTISPECIES: metallopeptidase family protein [Rhodomicrobium]|uniref:metallopeptidase family protein n=1 Tax=Rhodomicrobium TaxID=1068 RepID=UPI000B4B8E7A|nr:MULTISPECIES: metallopeptidase family protein [Rhodomicrobium]